jgi:D-3-phosphoglycerate dehydrogenase
LQIGILEPYRFSESALITLRSLGDVSLYDGRDLGAFLKELHVLFVRLNFQLDTPFFEKAPNLRYLCSPTTGHNHIDEFEVDKRGIQLFSLRGEKDFLSTIRATPEHTFGLILGLLRRYGPLLSSVKGGKFDRDEYRGEELFGSSVGIVGMGRVGCQVAKYCEAFGATISYTDLLRRNVEASWQFFSTTKMLIQHSDILVLCASYDFGQKPIITSSEIELLRGKYFVNTARGELVDEAALLRFVKNNEPAGVALDVLSRETSKDNHLQSWIDLIGERNLILTPHLGGSTYTSMDRTEVFIVEKLRNSISKDLI